ncbi:MAG: hypothetical protein DRI90_09375 [Deltaproteobacteria bacterium]|nr:MAG: hypothetical protein DRI90_09375 [Deltaproteobacteria bacterium]
MVASADILNACGIAFGAVFVLLIALAAIMQLITLIFPEEQVALGEPERPAAALRQPALRQPALAQQPAATAHEPRDRQQQIDPPVVAAISNAVASIIPGATVIRIEEES